MNVIFNAMMRKARSVEPWKEAFKSARKYVRVTRNLPIPIRLKGHGIRRISLKRRRLAENMFRRMRGQPVIHYKDDILRTKGPVFPVGRSSKAKIRLGTREIGDRNYMKEEVWARENPGVKFPAANRAVSELMSRGSRFAADMKRPVRYASRVGFVGLGAYGAHKVKRSLRSHKKEVRKSCGFINDSGLYQTYDTIGNMIELLPGDGVLFEKSGSLPEAMAQSICKIFGRGLANVT